MQKYTFSGAGAWICSDFFDDGDFGGIFVTSRCYATQ